MAGEPEGMMAWLCRVCCCCSCCGYSCCCCEKGATEKHPLLGINGKPIPKDYEVQEMNFQVSEPSSPGGSTPWGSEKQSEASEPPDFGDLEAVQRQPISSAEPGAHREQVNGTGEGNGHTSWKLVSSVPQEQQQFIIKIRRKE